MIPIVLEGLDGAGKSTVIQKLQQALQEVGARVLAVRDPGSTEFGELTRKILLDKNIPMAPMASLLTYGAIRAQLVHELLVNDQRYDMVLLDRFWHSTVAYQAYGQQLPITHIYRMNDLLDLQEVEGRRFELDPRLCFYLDVSDEVARERMTGRLADRFEGQKQEFRNRVRRGYESLVDSRLLVRIDAGRPVAEVVQDIQRRIIAVRIDEPTPIRSAHA